MLLSVNNGFDLQSPTSFRIFFLITEMAVNVMYVHCSGYKTLIEIIS